MKKILLIDDDADDKQIFELALDALNIEYSFMYAPDGEEALKLIKELNTEQPDYIFLDLNMPRINGVTFLTEMRSQNLYPDVPVFIYTTSSAGPDIDKCLKLGASLFTKHSSFAKLCADLKQRIVDAG